MSKNNLVLVHSFPTNSTLLHGLKEFLADFFNVYFIDLPGFNVDVSPIKDISFDNYSKFVEDKIKQLKLENYFLGGVSFGFFVVNNCKVDEKCKGFFAIEPFINIHYLKKSWITKFLMKCILSIITNFHLHKKIYGSNFFKKFLLTKNPKHRIDTMLNTVDGYTFFETAKIILRNNVKPTFKQKPYVLVINEEDDTIESQKIIALFNNSENKLIIKTKSEHYPENPTKEYFQKSINGDNIKKILSFTNSV